jgi:cell pole-organizing protein PopZ
MSNMERAPEPTMEEILASIRRIISDDESNSTQQVAPPGRRDELRSEVEEEADTKIINDIARVLSGTAAPGDEDDEILDLTKELGELQAVVEDPAMAMPDPEFPAPTGEIGDTAIYAAEAEEVQIPAVEASEPEPEVPSDEMTSADETLSAFDRAIAALRAGEFATSMPEPEPELVLMEPEFETEALLEAEPAEIAPKVEAEAPSWESDAAPWESSEEPAVEPEPASVRVNGGGMHSSHTAQYSELGSAPRSLEDNVKEMLRPLLRQWLDEHMSRVLEAALRDELKDAEARWRRNEPGKWPY